MRIFNLSIIIAFSVLILYTDVSVAQATLNTPADRKSESIRLYNQSVKPLIDGDYQHALELLKAACELDDSQPLMQNNYGLALLKVGKVDEALDHLLKATSSKNVPLIAWLNLGNAYENKGQYQNAVDSFEKYLAVAPTSPDAPKIRAHVELVKKEFLGTNKSQSPPNTEDYFDAVTRKVELRWSLSSMPIKVYVEKGNNISGFKPDYAALLKQAFDDWQSAAAGKISIVFVNDKHKADITTRWSNDLSEVASAAEGGDAKYRGTSKGLTNVAITLLTVDPSSTMKLTPNIVSWIAHHEVGHALGLLGHSPDIKDIMYFSSPHVDKPAMLSQRDVKTIVKLYSVDLLPTALTLNDEGVAAQKRGDSELAIKKYKEALALDSSDPIPERNLIRAHSAWAIALIKRGNLDEGESQFKEALALEDKAPDENLGSLIKNYTRLLHMMHKDDQAEMLQAKYKDAL